MQLNDVMARFIDLLTNLREPFEFVIDQSLDHLMPDDDKNRLCAPIDTSHIMAEMHSCHRECCVAIKNDKRRGDRRWIANTVAQ